jgi:hypothetical protein
MQKIITQNPFQRFLSPSFGGVRGGCCFKSPLLGVVGLLLLLGCMPGTTITNAQAQQKQTYDIAEYIAPAGWTVEEATNIIRYVRTVGDRWSIINIYRSTVSKGNAKADMDSEWQQLVSANYTMDNVINTIEPKAIEGGWTMAQRAGGRTGTNMAVILTMFSNNKRVISVKGETTLSDFVKDYNAFLKSFTLKATEHVAAQNTQQQAGQTNTTPPAQNTNTSPPAANTDNALSGFWGLSVWEQNGAGGNSGGYTDERYTFNTDGTYSFVRKTDLRFGGSYISFDYETGNWLVSGNKLTITPKKGAHEEWSKSNKFDNGNWGKLVKTSSRALNVSSYTFTVENSPPSGKKIMLQNNSNTQNKWYYYKDAPGSSKMLFPPGYKP